MARSRDNIERGRRLEEALKKKGWNQKRLAAEMHVHPSNISHAIAGERGMTRERAELAARLLDVDADDLSEVISPSLLASIRQLEHYVKILALRGSGVDDPSSAQAEELAQWLRGGSRPHEGTP